MQKINLLLAALLFSAVVSAQNVAITDDGTYTADPSAMLDVKSTDKGMLIPRIDFNDKPTTPATGLLVFVTANGPDGDNAFYYYNGSAWVKIAMAVSETDPVYNASQAANITSTDITNLGNLSGVNTGDQDLSALATKTALGDSTAQVRGEIPDVSSFLTSETDPRVPAGTQTGEMQYWNGSAWVTVAAGSTGQKLSNVNGVPTWINNDAMIDPVSGQIWSDVTSTTGAIWMDRNLGATQVATSSTDASAYGDLYQWGRGTDGHQIRTLGTITTLSNSDTPGHGDFIISASSPYDWRSPQNDNLWQGVSGINNPCPSGYRLPTEAELEAERTSWGISNSAGAFASPLKLPRAGVRSHTNGSLVNVGSGGGYWSSTVGGTYSRLLYFYSSDAYMGSGGRADGLSVRCLKD